MAGVVNDIEALAEFRAHLMRFNHDLAENFATIQGHWRELGEMRLAEQPVHVVAPDLPELTGVSSGRSGATTCTGCSARRSKRSRRASRPTCRRRKDTRRTSRR